jgi:hypothetical protein
MKVIKLCIFLIIVLISSMDEFICLSPEIDQFVFKVILYHNHICL